MTPIQIIVGHTGSGLPNFLTALMPPLVAAGAALGGVWLSNLAADRRRKDEKAEKRDVMDRDKGLAALAFAEHLEDYTIDCAKVVTSARQNRREFGPDVEEFQEPIVWLSDLPPWPELVDWRLLGFDRAVRASNLRRKVQYARVDIDLALEVLDGPEAHEVAGDHAATLGLLSWALASETRVAFGLSPFEWPDNWSSVANLERWQSERADRRAKAIEVQTDC